MARGLKFQIYEVEELYYLLSENIGADQLHGYPSRFSHSKAQLFVPGVLQSSQQESHISQSFTCS